MMLEYERTMLKLLKGQPKPKLFGRLINGKFLTGTLSLHRTKQSLAWQKFIRIHKRVDQKCSKQYNSCIVSNARNAL